MGQKMTRRVKWAILFGGGDFQIRLGIFGFLLMIFISHLSITWHHFKLGSGYAVQGTGEVVRMVESDSYRGVVYRFFIDKEAVEYTGEIQTSSFFNQKQPVKVSYLADDPEYNFLSGYPFQSATGKNLIVDGIMLLLLIFLLNNLQKYYLINKKAYRLITTGKQGVATFRSMRRIEKSLEERYYSRGISPNSSSLGESMAESTHPLHEISFNYIIPEIDPDFPDEKYDLKIKTKNISWVQGRREFTLFYNPATPKDAFIYESLEHLPERTSRGGFKFPDLVWDRFVVPALFVMVPLFALWILPAQGLIPGEVLEGVAEMTLSGFLHESSVIDPDILHSLN